MSSVQTGQLISLLSNNVLMVIIVAAVTAAAWLRWHWLRTGSNTTQAIRHRAYVSFLLAAATLLGMVTSLGILTLRAVVAVNALVVGAMGIFLLSVVALLLGLGLWFIDQCRGIPTTAIVRRVSDRRPNPPMALLPASVMGAHPRRPSRRAQRRQQR
ncbi:MAG: hypothetical protein AAGI45_18010 [Cyanobacteria bacterium P01_H01_bin.26]